jgi:hypothetical protein
MSRLEVVERATGGLESVERTLLLDEQPIAVAFVDTQNDEVTLVWITAQGVELPNVLENFFFSFLENLGDRFLTMGFWIEDRYQEKKFDHRPLVEDIVSTIRQYPHASTGLTLLNLFAGDITLELVFNRESTHPNRIALVISAVDITGLTDFFAQFHTSNAIRQHSENPAFRLVPSLPNCLEYMIH